MHPCFYLRTSLAIALAGAAFLAPSNATLILHEGFDYGPAETPLTGLNGGFGFAGAWVTGNSLNPNANAGAGNSLTIKPGLSYSGWISSGASAGEELVVAGTPASSAQNARLIAFDTAGLIAPGNELWFSALVRQTNAGVAYVRFFTHNPSAAESGDSIGQSGGFGFNVNAGNGQIAAALKGSIAPGTIAGVTLNETYLVVGRVTFSATPNQQNVQLWVNPSETATDVASLTATALGTSSRTDVVSIGSYLFIHSMPTAATFFDEIRLGTSLDSVLAPIPEPATVAHWIGVATLAFAAWRRRLR